MPRIEKFCMVGALGWNHPDWVMSYYPHDIPDEWRVLFFAHEFDALLLPQADWVAGDQAFFDQLEEAQSECQLMLQFDWCCSPETRERALGQLEQLRGFISGVVVQAPPDALDERALFNRLAALVGDEVQLAIDLVGGGDVQSQTLPDQFRPVWHSDRSAGEQNGATIGLVQGWPDRTELGLHRLVESFAQQAPVDAVGLSLFFTDQPPSIALMSHTQALLEQVGPSDRG